MRLKYLSSNPFITGTVGSQIDFINSQIKSKQIPINAILSLDVSVNGVISLFYDEDNHDEYTPYNLNYEMFTAGVNFSELSKLIDENELPLTRLNTLYIGNIFTSDIYVIYITRENKSNIIYMIDESGFVDAETNKPVYIATPLVSNDITKDSIKPNNDYPDELTTTDDLIDTDVKSEEEIVYHDDLGVALTKNEADELLDNADKLKNQEPVVDESLSIPTTINVPKNKFRSKK